MAELLAVSLAVIVSSALTAYFITPAIIRRMNKRGLVGRDMNKAEKPEVAELGGISVLFALSIGLTTAIFAHTYLGFSMNLTAVLAAFLTVVLIGFLGIVDDLIGWKKGIRQYQHALFPLFAALPLMALKVGETTMNFPFVGDIHLGILYSLLVVPIGVTGAANAFNMLAGFNGLEAGMGAIITGTIAAIAFMAGSFEAMILMLAIFGALLAFLKFNWFPAKIFPGDSLTLMIGASIAAAVIIGNMEKIGVMLLALYFVELGFKAKHKFQSECYGIPQEDGTLQADPRGGSLTQWIMRRGSFTEKQVVARLLLAQGAISLIVFLLFYFKLFI